MQLDRCIGEQLKSVQQDPSEIMLNDSITERKKLLLVKGHHIDIFLSSLYNRRPPPQKFLPSLLFNNNTTGRYSSAIRICIANIYLTPFGAW